MPALVWFGRRWRTGTDDFTFSSVLYFAITAVCGILGITRITVDKGNYDGDEAAFNYFKRCLGASFPLGACFLGLSVTDLVAAVFFLVTAALSLRGGIYEVSKRSLVPLFLYVNMLTVAAMLVLTAICTKYALYDGERRTCNGVTSRILEGSLALNFVVCCMFALSFMVVYDPSGRKAYDSPEQYAEAWWKRCRLLCCRCRKETRDDDAFRDVASVFSQAFCAYDMVPSDLAAGMLLLHGYQYHSRRIIRERVRFAPPVDRDGNELVDYARREKISSQAVPAKRLSEAQRVLVRELQQYSRFYMAAYGYLLYEFNNCCTGLPRLCCFDPCMCCRHHSGRHYDTRCFCNVTALLKESQIAEEDLILTSWSNHLFKPVHYVCYDYTTDAVVVAVRGTMSFIDIATDFAATPEVVELDGADALEAFTPADFYIHGGMLQSARYVWRCLEYNGVLDLLRTGKYKDTKLVVLGHSLGAGVALVLSVLLHSDMPEVRGRMRCLAYAPPGGTLSQAVVEYCKDFTVGGFLGYDLVPRLSQHTVDSFREAIFDVTAASRTPKSLMYLSALRTQDLARPLHPSTSPQATPSAPALTAGAAVTLAGESAMYREDLRHGSCVPLSAPKELFPCHTLIHFRKAIERSSCDCCGLCGEANGCCGGCGGLPSVCVEEVYYPCVEGPKDVQMLLAAPSMFTDHFPERFFNVMEETVRQLDDSELERFYQDDDPVEFSEDDAPLHYLSPVAASARLRERTEKRATAVPQEPVHSYGSTP